MKLRVLKSTALIAIIFSISCIISCDKAEPELPETKVIFKELDSIIDKEYGFTDNSAFSREKLYAASLDGAGVKTEKSTVTLDDISGAISTMNPEKKRNAIIQAVHAYMKSLPMGYNDSISPNSIALSKDPRHTAGTGIILRKDGTGKFYILDILEDSPASREKIEPGKYIKSIDGKDVSNIVDLEEIVGLIKGLPDTEVEIVTTGGKYTLIRGPVQFKNILHSTWKNKNGDEVEYIMVRTTLPGTSKQLRGLLMDINSRGGIILDMRKLHTGDPEESFHVADIFLSEEKMGSIRTKIDGTKVMTADPDQLYTGKIVIITGKDSSAFAHITALAMKSSEKVTIIGTPPENATFVSQSKTLPGGFEVRFATGSVYDSNDNPMYETSLTMDETISNEKLPSGVPSSAPEKDDEAAITALSLLGKSN